MVINFKAREISRGARKLARTPILIKKTEKLVVFVMNQSRYAQANPNTHINKIKQKNQLCSPWIERSIVQAYVYTNMEPLVTQIVTRFLTISPLYMRVPSSLCKFQVVCSLVQPCSLNCYKSMFFFYETSCRLCSIHQELGSLIL